MKGRQEKETCPPWKGDLFTWNMGNFLHQSSLASALATWLMSQKAKAGTSENEEPPTSGEGQVRDLNVHKFVGSDEMYPVVLRELTDGVLKSLSTIFEKS